MTSDDGRIALTFNGVIYNFRELRLELERSGHQFLTTSDTEVLLRSYLEWGDRCPAHFNGQFAFAIWDDEARTLFAARDRLGEKPFYWATDSDGAFLFASELKQLLASGRIRPILDPSAIAAYLALHYIPPNRTAYANVHSLLPGHTLTVTQDDVTTHRYWEPRFSHNDIDHAEATVRIRELVESAIERQLVADVPVGAFLSGGLDSATIVAGMSGRMQYRPMTFSVGFPGLVDERPYARTVAKRYGTDHHEISIGIDAAALVQKMADIYDEPFADSSNIPTYLLARFARSMTKVVLAGDGGDELFGGYTWYRRLREADQLARYGLASVAAFTAGAAVHLLARTGRRSVETYRRLERAQVLLEMAKQGSPILQRHLHMSTYLSSLPTLGLGDDMPKVVTSTLVNPLGQRADVFLHRVPGGYRVVGGLRAGDQLGRRSPDIPKAAWAELDSKCQPFGDKTLLKLRAKHAAPDFVT